MTTLQEKVLKDAQYRKGLSIAFFNATNAAIELVKNGSLNEKERKERIVFWRDWLLEEHKNYYATTIASVGVNYSVEEAVKKLNATKNYEELSSAWRLLSEDERREPAIIKVAKDLKKKYKEEKTIQLPVVEKKPKAKKVTKVAKKKNEKAQ